MHNFIKYSTISYFFILYCLIFSLFHLQASETKRLQVIASQSIIADWVQNVAKDTINLGTLVPANTDIHTFEPTPKDAIQLEKADLIFENGLGLEYWLNYLYKSSNSHAKRITLSDVVEKIAINSHNHVNHDHDHGDYNPHTWLDPQNAIRMVIKIAEVLSQADPDNADFYKANSDAYIAQLKNLDTWIATQIKQIPPQRRKLITNHDSLTYYAKRYGLESLDSILQSASTENVEPSASHFTKLLKLIKKDHIPAIFAENIHSQTLIRQLAREANLPTPKILYTGALGPHSSPANTYINLMRYNTQTIVESLE